MTHLPQQYKTRAVLRASELASARYLTLALKKACPHELAHRRGFNDQTALHLAVRGEFHSRRATPQCPQLLLRHVKSAGPEEFLSFLEARNHDNMTAQELAREYAREAMIADEPSRLANMTATIAILLVATSLCEQQSRK